MKYFFVLDSKDKRHIIVAKDIDSATNVATEAKLIVNDIYELVADTFTTPGFLISDK